MWTQIAGKIRLAPGPPVNHWWHTALYVNPRGLTTSLIPYGAGGFEIQFDFIGHQIEILSSDGNRKSLPLAPESVAAFHDRLMSALRSMRIEVAINEKPQEVADA